MKKIFFYIASVCLLAACSADESIVKGDGIVMDTNGNVIGNAVTYVNSLSGDFVGGRLGVRALTPPSAAPASRTYYIENLYMESSGDQDARVPATAANLDWRYVNLICNEAYGLNHGDNGWAVKTVATGTLDNNRKTYSWFYNDKGEQQNVIQNSQGILLVGYNCNLDDFNHEGGRPVVYVGNEWFNNSFAKAQSFIDEAMETEAKTAYYQLQNGGDNLDAPFTYYEYNGYKVVLLDYDMQNGSCVVDDVMNEDMKAPWAEGHGEAICWPVDADSKTIDHKVIVVPTKATTTFDGRNLNANFFAPGKELTFTGGGAPSGLVICDKITMGAGTELHGSQSDTFDFTPVPTDPEDDCNASAKIDLDIKYDYVVEADDFALHNGDLYEKAAVKDHEGVANGQSADNKAYVKVNGSAGGNIEIAVEDICELYPSYIGKMNNEGKPYISEDGVLTLEVYIWPGKIEDDKFVSCLDLGEGYIIGAKDAPVEYAPDNKHYSVKVSAYKGYQSDGTVAYIHVSVHIQPRDLVK